MTYKNILITGGAGFVGSNLCCRLAETFPKAVVTAFDNLKRRGAELTLSRLREHGVQFHHGDVRSREDFDGLTPDLLIECSAEPSVMAGVGSSPRYVIDTNLLGAINCFELARTCHADVIFLSTSRVYPVDILNALVLTEDETRFSLNPRQLITGVSKKGVSEKFPLDGARTLYGATKLSAEIMLIDYIRTYGIKGIINRCGLIAGPWQMGKTDQGVITYWMAHHIFNKPLSYIGFGGTGKQVRDVVHVDDIADLVEIEMKKMNILSGETMVVGGGESQTVSLRELTDQCRQITGKTVPITSDSVTRQGDIPWYCSDYSYCTARTGWKPARSLSQTLEDIYTWITAHPESLHRILA